MAYYQQPSSNAVQAPSLIRNDAIYNPQIINPPPQPNVGGGLGLVFRFSPIVPPRQFGFKNKKSSKKSKRKSSKKSKRKSSKKSKRKSSKKSKRKSSKKSKRKSLRR